MENKNTERLAKEPVGKLFFKLALPAVIAQVVSQVNAIVDRIWIGHIDGYGSLALTAIGICMPIIVTFLSLGVMIGAGAGPRLSILLGKNDVEGAKRTLGTTVWFILLVSILSMLVIFCFPNELLHAFGASDSSLLYGRQYLLTSAWGLLFLNTIAGIVPLLYAQGMVKQGMMYSISSVAINMILDPIFIFGLDMGIMGAALATNVGLVVASFLTMRLLLGHSSAARLKKEYIRYSPVYLRPCLTLGLSTLAALVSESVAMLFYNRSLLALDGDTAVGAMAVYVVFTQLTSMILLGIASGGQPIISYCYGAKLYDRVRQSMSVTLWSCTAVSALVWLAVMLFPTALMSAFSDDAGLTAYCSRYARIYFGLLVLIGTNYAIQYILKALGKAWASLFLGLVRRLFLLLPLIALMPILLPERKVEAIFMTAPLIEILTLALSLYYYFRIKRSVAD